MIMARMWAKKVISRDSRIYWVIICPRSAPDTFLIPTSLDRPSDLAVDIFIKLIQAIIRIRNAIPAKI